MNPHDFLDVAENLVSGLIEAEWRSAASRAYYSVFHIARNLLISLGFEIPRDEKAHAYLWLRLSNCDHPDVQNAGSSVSEVVNQITAAMRNYEREVLGETTWHP